MNTIETKQDVIDYLERDLEQTEEGLKLGVFRDLFGGHDVTVAEKTKNESQVIMKYVRSLLLPILKGEIKHHQEWKTKSEKP